MTQRELAEIIQDMAATAASLRSTSADFDAAASKLDRWRTALTSLIEDIDVFVLRGVGPQGVRGTA